MDEIDDNIRGLDGHYGTYLKKHTEALIKDVGYEKACSVTGKSKATLGRYFSMAPEHTDRFMPIDVVADLEEVASFPFVTKALAELRMLVIEYDKSRMPKKGALNADIVLLSQRFANLMGEYNDSIADGVISLNEAKRLLRETSDIQQVLLDMKLHLEQEAQS